MKRKLEANDAVAIMLSANLRPIEEYKGTEYPWRSICLKCNREVSPRLRSVRDRKSGCKFCSGNAVVPEEAVLEMRKNNLEPLTDFPGAGKPWSSRCIKCSNKVSPRLSDIRMGHSGCKKCADLDGGKKRRLDSNPVRSGKSTNFQKVLDVMKNANLEPLENYAGSQSKWKCKCLNCGAIVSPRYTTILQGGGGCMNCFRKEQIGRGLLDSNSAKKIMLKRNLLPLEEYPGAMKPWKCKCLDCNNEIKPRYAHVQQGRKGCTYCARKKIAEKLRIPQSEAISIAKENGFNPLEPYRGRHYAWKCKCMKCGEIVSPHFSGIVTGGGCRFCSGLVVDPKSAQKVMEKSGLTPLVQYPGAGVPWLCECKKCKKEVYPRYSSVNRGIGGCKFCATHGYDFSRAGTLYLITNDKLSAHKIGITNEDTRENRLKKHSKEGWETYKTHFFSDGNLAFEVEQEILTWWRNDLGLGVYLSSTEMPQGGFTETVDAGEIDLSTIWNYVIKSIDVLQKKKPAKNFIKSTLPKKLKKV